MLNIPPLCLDPGYSTTTTHNCNYMYDYSCTYYLVYDLLPILTKAASQSNTTAISEYYSIGYYLISHVGVSPTLQQYTYTSGVPPFGRLQQCLKHQERIRTNSSQTIYYSIQQFSVSTPVTKYHYSCNSTITGHKLKEVVRQTKYNTYYQLIVVIMRQLEWVDLQQQNSGSPYTPKERESRFWAKSI